VAQAITYRIGVDGGGSKTELLLLDQSGRTVARHHGPGCSPSHLGPEQARENFLGLLRELLAAGRVDPAADTITHTQLFMAGSPGFWRELADSLQGFGRVTTGPDSLPVLELATGGAPGLVLHSGTGSFVAARGEDGAIHYAGGHGWKFGDPGSAFDVGRRAIASALFELQGWAPATGLGAALQAHTGLADAAANTRFFYSDGGANARIAGFAPRVIELAGQDVRPAQAALAGSLADFVAQGRAVSQKLFGEMLVPCGLSGALLLSPPAVQLLRGLAETHAWNVDYRFIHEPPITGVRRLLLAAG
jgi:N-acetylglucosamine kinase-like BadF-type ATPase